MEETKTSLVKELEQFEPDVFWQKHGKRIIAGTVVVLIVIVGALMWQRQQQTADEAEGYRLAKAVDIVALEQFVSSSKSKLLMPLALVKLGDLQFRDGQYAESAASYQRVVDGYPQSPSVSGARFSLAAIMEAQGQFEAARGAYSQIAGGSVGYGGYLARLGVARCTEALGQVKEARQLYEELLMAGQASGGQSLAMVRWAVLGRSVPTGEVVVPVVTNAETTANQLVK